MNCMDKFLKHSERVGARFAEHNAGTSTSGMSVYFCSLPRTEMMGGAMNK